MVKIYQYIVVICVCLLLSGCTRMVDWAKESFQQVSVLDVQCNAAQKYIKSTTVYDQLTTKAKFDVMWLADDVRSLYVDLFALKHGKTSEQKKILLRRQLEENNHRISFYVLSMYEVSLGELMSEWSIFLQIDNKNYPPIEIKAVELLPEYICMFGKKFNRFKVAYSVKFDARNIEENFLLTPDTKNIALYFRSTTQEVIFTWDLSVAEVAV